MKGLEDVQPKKDLMMGYVSNILIEDTLLFLKSLDQTGFSGELVLFTEGLPPHFEEATKNFTFGVRLIPIQREDSEWKYMIYEYRFLQYYKFLLGEGKRYSNVLLTDVRDVFFQTNPFLEDWSKDSITVAVEAWRIYQDETYNGMWIRKKFGNEVLSSIQHQPILCAGTIYGPTIYMIGFLKVLTHILFDNEYVPQSDQASLNYLVHKEIISAAYSDNESGPMMTVGLETQFHINEDNQVLLKNGNVASIIHQYDRHDQLNKLFRSKIFS